MKRNIMVEVKVTGENCDTPLKGYKTDLYAMTVPDDWDRDRIADELEEISADVCKIMGAS